MPLSRNENSDEMLRIFLKMKKKIFLCKVLRIVKTVWREKKSCIQDKFSGMEWD